MLETSIIKTNNFNMLNIMNQSKFKNITTIQNKIFSCKFCIRSIIHLFLIGSYKENHSKTTMDIDLVTIIKDDTNYFTFMRKLSPILSDCTKEIDILVTCFPIHFSIYSKSSSQFIKNVKNNGIKLKI